tara:strand:+ start:36 stop:572 length:537 start_codon:yes stop_codon:yes gene_type:complete
MKIVNNYKDLGELGIDAKKIIYSKIKNKIYQKNILELLPNGKSVWIDSYGSYNNDPNVISFENAKWKGIFKSADIKYYKDFYSPTLYESINKYIKPSSIVIYGSCEFRYINKQELMDNINFLIKSYHTKLLIYIDTVFIDFNKLKYSPQHIIEETKKHTDSRCKIHSLNDFKYIFEIN